jgi:hypothetical protein
MKEADTALVLKVGADLLRQVAEESGFEDHIEIRSRFRLRDSQIEHIGWALMAPRCSATTQADGCLWLAWRQR